MNDLEDILKAIARLSSKELAELRTWFRRFDADAWDRQIEEDAQSGRLDGLFERLQQENGTGKR
ncbi:hypothetical protein OKA05_14170 [Luteolibacter arcticus]|uniref:Uncharacterized protein n=1 Tax=Luteolibacter arcticus TaxID=1581411 RepID=A0ABT3GJK1_9BACT|nr:hypothetical protein [Luteolibacter arcticus]MCW1923708.1 hypothetical protein [Luteolibacter arcticus]